MRFSFAAGLLFAAAVLVAGADGTDLPVPDRFAPSIAVGRTGAVLYNPLGYAKLVERSEPEGVLFETVVRYLAPTAPVSTCHTGSVVRTMFSHWTRNGVPQRDAWGRALDSLAFRMPKEETELVAHAEWDATARFGLYWLGDAAVDPTSDADGDGYAFIEEIAVCGNPLFPDAFKTNFNGVFRASARPVVFDTVEFNRTTSILLR